MGYTVTYPTFDFNLLYSLLYNILYNLQLDGYIDVYIYSTYYAVGRLLTLRGIPRISQINEGGPVYHSLWLLNPLPSNGVSWPLVASPKVSHTSSPAEID